LKVAQNVGEHLKYPHNKIRFTAAGGQNGAPKTVLRRHSNHTLAEMIQPSYAQNANNLLYYELLDVTLTELETKKTVRVTWMGLHNKEEGQHTFLMAKTANMNDIIDNLAKNVKLSTSKSTPTKEGTGKIRLFEVPPQSAQANGKQQKLLSGNELIKDITALEDLYAEEIPTEEAEVREDEKVITCYHFLKDPARPHGVPFRFVIKPVSIPRYCIETM
jgi:ubiquitin carboxyl-terminal hydrolase 7